MRQLSPLLLIVLALGLSLALGSCSDKPYLKAPTLNSIDQITNGMRLTYRAQGLNEDQLSSKSSRNMAYRLALHLKTEATRAQLIHAHPDQEAMPRHYAEQTIAQVRSQFPGYPVPEIFDVLLGSKTLAEDQQLLLLACTAELIAKSEVKADAPPSLHR